MPSFASHHFHYLSEKGSGKDFFFCGQPSLSCSSPDVFTPSVILLPSSSKQKSNSVDSRIFENRLHNIVLPLVWFFRLQAKENAFINTAYQLFHLSQTLNFIYWTIFWVFFSNLWHLFHVQIENVHKNRWMGTHGELLWVFFIFSLLFLYFSVTWTRNQQTNEKIIIKSHFHGLQYFLKTSQLANSEPEFQVIPKYEVINDHQLSWPYRWWEPDIKITE